MERHDPKSTVAMLSGLLTVPTLQANAIRLETLVHLAVAHSRGRTKPRRATISKWINKCLGHTQVRSIEDPVEDVFVTNVETVNGDYLLFQSQWESSDYYVQTAIDVLGRTETPQQCQRLLIPAFALLALSDCVARRLGLQRWVSEPSVPQGTVRLPSASQLDRRARAVTFTPRDLDELGITRDTLDPFVLRDQDKHDLASDTLGNSSLERRPIVEIDGDIVLTLTNAVSPAIRRFVLTELRRLGELSRFSQSLARHQMLQVNRYGLIELKETAKSIPLRVRRGKIPPLASTLIKYDHGKYMNVVTLHDSMDRLDRHGLTSMMEYSTRQQVALDRYLTRVARYCKSFPDFAEGMTLLIYCGLGGGYALGLNFNPGSWTLSAIPIPDLLMLAAESDRPITRYIKFVTQRESVETQGVTTINFFGDYNLYCYWRNSHHRLVPLDVPLRDGSHILRPTDSVFPVRREIRNLIDRHTLQTTRGSHVPVMRIGVGAPFTSLQCHPVYGSLTHLDDGRLGGAVETSRGISWLLVKPRQGDENVQYVLYRMWHDVIFLYGKLILEIENEYPNATEGPIEVELNLDDAVMPVDDDYVGVEYPTGVPTVELNMEHKKAEIRFPSDLFSYFRQPENTGERLILISICEAALRVRRVVEIDESILDELVSRVIDHDGIRIFHIFRTHDAVERLLAQQNPNPTLCTYYDINFLKLGLSEGCTSNGVQSKIKSKDDSNKFLHCVVRNICTRLIGRLRQFDCLSVIHRTIQLHEAAVQDRVHWRRTAQAIIGLYGKSDDVHAIARERETDRSNTSLAARTILEMAICECPTAGGKPLSQSDLDDLIAETLIFIQAATDSDAIYYELTEPLVELHANGEYTIDRNFNDTLITPFKRAYYTEEFEKAARRYGEMYQYEAPGDRMKADEVLSLEFNNAFSEEFGLTPDDAIIGLREMMALALDRNSIVVDTTCGNVRTVLMREGQLTPDASEAFIRTLTICRRDEWNSPPPGFKDRDLYPWRFSRRLSTTFRPIVAFGTRDDDRLVFGAGTLRRGVMHLMAKTECGHLPSEFFMSQEMRRYIGSTNNKRGHAFARTVAEAMSGRRWNTRVELQMTELGAPAELGDVDVLAWNSVGDIQLIECKRLQLPRTVAEIGELCRRFRGDAKDQLDKHVRRVEWIKARLTCLQSVIGFVPDPDRVDVRLVTDTHVPMTYVKSLPIDADMIGPLDWMGAE